MNLKTRKEFRLPKEFGEKWLKALRSGKYTQGSSYLYNDSEDNYCCLGVACVINKIELKSIVNKTFITESVSSKNLIPKEIVGRELLALVLAKINDGPLNSYLSQEVESIFKEYNIEDKTYTFDEIADFIQENVEFYEN